MSDNRTDLPSVNSPNFTQRLRETVQTYLGRQGDPLERGLTLRDLIESGLAKLPQGARLRPGAASVPLKPGDAILGAYEPDLTPPPQPSGFVATPAISHILIEHDVPLYSVGHGHLRTRVYGAIYTSGPLPVFSDAVEVAQFSGAIYALPTNPATTWHLWVKWETSDGVLSATPAGGTNGVGVTSGQDVSHLLEALTGQLQQSQLGTSLSARINLIDASSTVLGSVAYRVSQEAAARAQALLDEAAARTTADSALQTQINTLSAASSDGLSQLAAAVQEEQVARIAGDNAEASSRLALAAQMRGAYTGTDIAQVTTGLLFSEAQARANSDSAIVTSVNTLSATVATKNKTYQQAAAPTAGMTAGDVWYDSDDSNKPYRYDGSAWVATDDARIAVNAAAITAEQTARANADSALASQITTLSATVNGNAASLQQEITTRASETGGLLAQYTVKVDVNGYVAGYGLAATANNGTPTSEFVVVADKFAIAPVQTDNTADDGSPFFHRTTATTINGVSVPAGTYMKAAYIHDATITNAKIANLAVDNAKIANVSVDKLTAGSIAVGQYIQSTSYIAGQQGWRINGDGNAEFANVVIRGSGRFWGELVNGTATAFDAGTGLYSGYDNGNYKFRIGTADGARLQWDSNSLLIRNANLDITSSGGSSISMSPSGSSILFKKADGTNSLSVDQQGNAVFSGSLYGATGTFEGTLAAGVLSSSAFDAIEYKYTTSGTYSLTIPPKKSGWTAMHMRITVQGAGGGGGGGYANAGPNRNPVSSGGGGGAGQRQVFTVTSGVEPGQAVTVVVGQGGAGGQDAGGGWAGSNGGNGSASYVVVGGSQYTASGGVGGGVGTMGLADSALGGAGGSLGGVPGGGGNYGTRYDSVTETYAPNSNYGGAGGSSMYGSGGNGGPAWNGYAAQGGAGGMGAGGGGGGADAEHPDRRYTGWGGPGGGGFVLIELFDPNTVVLNNRYSNLILWLDSRGIGTVPTEAR